MSPFSWQGQNLLCGLSLAFILEWRVVLYVISECSKGIEIERHQMIITTACIKILLGWIIICFSRAGRTNEGNRLTLQTKSKEFQRLHIGHIQCERVCGLVVKIGCHESSLISSEFSSTVFARLQKVVTIFKRCFNQKLCLLLCNCDVEAYSSASASL